MRTKVYTYKVFTHKELLKDYKEYLELHKRCVKTYLVGKSLEYSSIKKFFVIYDKFIDEENILPYFFHFGKQICGLLVPLNAQAFQGSVITIYLQLLSA